MSLIQSPVDRRRAVARAGGSVNDLTLRGAEATRYPYNHRVIPATEGDKRRTLRRRFDIGAHLLGMSRGAWWLYWRGTRTIR